MPRIDDFNPKSNSARNQHQSVVGYVHRQLIPIPVVAAAARILDDESINGAAHTVTTFLAQPDVPRNITIVASGAATGNIVVTGTNIRGATISETIALNGTTPVSGLKAFKTITSILFPQVSSTTVDIGVGDVLGLERCMEGNEVMFATLDGVYETTRPTVVSDNDEVEKNTIDINGTLNGAKNVVVCLVTKEIY